TLFWYCKNSAMCVQKHPFADLYIFGYYRDGTKYNYFRWDATNSACRGLITDLQGNVVQRPFSKFWTFKQYLAKDLLLLSEGQTKVLNAPVRAIHEKVDGTMGILYWVDDIPYIAAQRSFTNAKALKGTQILHAKYSHLFDQFDKALTYVFEIIYNETAILVQYDMDEELVLIGLIDTETGQALPLENCTMGFRMAKDFTSIYGSYKDELGKLESLDLPNAEGFVVTYQDESRVKLKFPSFRKAHDQFAKLLSLRRALALSEHAMFPALHTPHFSGPDVSNWTQPQYQDNLVGSRPVHHMVGFEYWMEYWHKRLNMENRIPRFDELVGNEFDLSQRLSEEFVHDTQTWKWKQLR
ncbi:MAG: hypothetical protein KA408_11555, partial [Flavobacteriales bacterium]|nr:hypothetical protein [Flavobacteriales bacterium]